MSKKLLSIFTAFGVLALSAIAGTPESGLKVGEKVTPFNPTHITGPLKGTSDCPPCTFGARPQVQVWVNADNMMNVVKIARLLEAEMQQKSKSELKAFVILLTDTPDETGKFLTALAERIGAKQVGLAYLKKSDEAVRNYKVNAGEEVKNTIFVYKNKTVSEKFVNLKADEKGLGDLSAAISKVTQ
jgi:hypothetical protein